MNPLIPVYLKPHTQTASAKMITMPTEPEEIQAYLKQFTVDEMVSMMEKLQLQLKGAMETDKKKPKPKRVPDETTVAEREHAKAEKAAAKKAEQDRVRAEKKAERERTKAEKKGKPTTTDVES